MSSSIPPAVRILPMDAMKGGIDNEGRSDACTQFLRDEMPWSPHPGRYRFREQGLRVDPATVVLFQHNAQIVGSAVLARVERYPEPEEGYKGALWFEVDSICVFNAVNADVVRRHWPTVKALGNAKHDLDPSRYSAFEQELTGIIWPARPVPTASDLLPPLPERIQVTLSRIVRDTELSRRVKVVHDFECQICGHTIVLSDGSRYAEAHHVQPLGEPHHGPDVMENILCLCPNHHAACDFGAIGIDASKLRPSRSHIVAQRYIDYHNSRLATAIR